MAGKIEKVKPVSKEDTTKEERAKELDAAIASIRKYYGEGSIMRLGDKAINKKLDVISTGALTLDVALGVGGLPKGRIVEIYGPESSGKTTLMLHIIANAQKMGGTAAFIDAEHALDPKYAKRLGVNIDDLLVSQPDTGEEALSICEQLVRSGALDVVVVDSVAALVPQAELEGDMGMATMGMQARLMSQALRKLTAILNRTNTLCLFTNQIRDKLGVMFGNPETTPGGRALKFYSSIRLDIRRKDILKDKNGNSIGNHTRVKVVKNKVAPPFTEATFDIIYNEGISMAGNVLDAAILYKIIVKRGSWLQYDGTPIGQGRDATVAELRKNDDLLQKLKEEVLAKLSQGEIAVDSGEETETEETTQEQQRE